LRLEKLANRFLNQTKLGVGVLVVSQRGAY
jgi:hypothetical protein